MTSFGPLVSAAWLRERLGEPGLRVIDFRWYLDGRSGRAAYEAGHIPGAAFVDLEGGVTGGGEGRGRHPLPDRESFQAAMREAGVDRGSRVVAYDDQGGFVAARLWWLLRWFGHDAVALLDGGLAAWRGALSSVPEVPAAGDFEAAEPAARRALDHQAVRRLGQDALLLDARAPERYRGEVEPLDPRAGHIPGARSAPWNGNLDAELRFLAPERLRARFRQLGVGEGGEVVAYCGSGVSACHNLLALELAGLGGGRLYEGSWSDWSRREDAPVAAGPEP